MNVNVSVSVNVSHDMIQEIERRQEDICIFLFRSLLDPKIPLRSCSRWNFILNDFYKKKLFQLCTYQLFDKKNVTEPTFYYYYYYFILCVKTHNVIIIIIVSIISD